MTQSPHKISDELKPCPFCGGDARLDSGFDSYWIECKHCGATAEGDKTHDTAIASWNKRAPVASSISDDELEKLALKLCDEHRDEYGLIDLSPIEMYCAGYRSAERNYEQALITKTPDCVTTNTPDERANSDTND